jgi:hypothetical protein
MAYGGSVPFSCSCGYPSFDWLDRVPPLDWLITVINRRAMTIYLWGNTMILLAYAFLGPYDWAYGWRQDIAVVVLTWLGIGLAVLIVGPVEDIAARRKPTLIPKRA